MGTQIQWFPGHMAKARREISEKMKLIDIVIELVDSRAPCSSKNPMFEDIIKQKPRLIVLTKKDMSDEKETAKWLDYYKSQGYHAVSVNLKNFNDHKVIVEHCKLALKDKMLKEQQRGLKPRAIRAMVMGIPNVGKSTFINRIANRKATVTGNKPGVTKSQQIIRVDKDFELFDTPGVLWPKFDDLTTARNIALIGSIKQDILPLDELFIYAVEYMANHYPDLLKERFDLTVDLDDEDWVLKSFNHIAKVRKIKPLRGETDYDRVIELLFAEIYSGAIGRVSWEKVECANV